ncbi:MAG: DUF2207 domain-containing protein [Candidatus Acidiferrales bacterium]
MRGLITFGFVLATLSVCAVLEAKLVAAPEEQIVTFDADIVVNPDATLTVREDFVVRSEGSYFKYGFTRDLPIDDEARWDERYAGKWTADNGIRVKILELTENGAPVRYQQASGAGYPQLRIGPIDVPLERGDHHYVIRYTVDGAVGLGAARDTLYWNAIGHYWTLPVGTARVTVHFPAGVAEASSVTSEARVGGRGVSNNGGAPPAIAEAIEDGSAGAAYIANGLQPLQSLSVVVTWPAGAVQKPALGIWSRDKWYLAAPVALCLYYFLAWLRIGRAPKPGTVVVRYEPPAGISAAAARYLTTTGTDGRTLAAVIASLAAHDCLRIEAIGGTYKLTRLAANPTEESKLAQEETHALRFLFEDGPTAEISPSMSQANSARNSRYVADIQGDLAKRFDGVYFTRHLGYTALGVLATFVIAFRLAATAQGRDTSAAFFMTAWLLFCALILGAVAETGLIPAWVAVFRGTGSWTKLMPATAATGVFGFFFGLLLQRLALGASPAFALMVAALALVNLIWAPFLKRMTPEGRATLDAIEGFRQFLESVERDRLERLSSSAAAPAAEAEYLPYAIALEVREAWGDHLAEAFFATTIQR